MATLQELLDRKAELEREIEATRRSQKAEAIAKVKALMAEHELSLADISSSSRAPKAAGSSAGSKVAAKYRNTATGDSWSGRGLQPRWLKTALAAGRSLEDFAV